jgi:hypothetical protein
MRHQNDAAVWVTAQRFAQQASNAVIELAHRLPTGRPCVRTGSAVSTAAVGGPAAGRGSPPRGAGSGACQPR